MRLLGILLAIMGSASLVYCVRNTLEAGRPKDVAFATAALLSSALALLGVALALVPGFLS